MLFLITAIWKGHCNSEWLKSCSSKKHVSFRLLTISFLVPSPPSPSPLRVWEGLFPNKSFPWGHKNTFSNRSLLCYLLDFIGFSDWFVLKCTTLMALLDVLGKKPLKFYLLCIVSLCQLNYHFSIWYIFVVLIFMGLSRKERWTGEL